ncbi:MAG: SusC/RagA family TonB-linked outer membrane protein, partial [Bacteroidetes bacterium HGW-Bacteroidetes-9]
MLIMMIAFVVNASAQSSQPVKGVVKDATTGETLIGVNVLIKGTSQGTITDIYGNYELAVDAGATLVFSYIGYVKQEIVVTASRTINVSLKADLAQLEEVVVIGYGTQKKS